MESALSDESDGVKRFNSNGKKVVRQKTRGDLQSKYKESFCEELIELGRKGKTTLEAACHFGIMKSTLHDWRKKHEKFGEAYVLFKQLSEQWWLARAQENLVEDPQGAKLNTGLYKFIVGGRFGHTAERRPTLDLSQGDIVKAMETVFQAIANKQVTKDEIGVYSNLLLASANIEQHQTLTKEVEKLRSIADQMYAERTGESDDPEG